MTIGKYKQVDILMLTVLAIACELIGYFAHLRFPDAGFYLSFSIILCIIGMVRWGWQAFMIYPIAGLVMVFTAGQGEIIQKILLYPVANSFIVFSVLYFKFVDRNELKASGAKTLLFVLCAYAAVAVGKGFAMLILAGGMLKGIATYVLVDLFNIIMVSIALLLLRTRDGLLSDMETYFKELEDEKEENEAV